MATIPETIESQRGQENVKIPTGSGVAVISWRDAERLLRGWQLVLEEGKWRVKR